MKKLFLTIGLTTALLTACVVDKDGKTIESCNPTETKATISDLRAAIAGGATTAGEMAGL